MTSKINAKKISDSTKQEVMEILRKFQEGYIKRDASKIDSYMEDIFAQGDDIVILGTSIGEWCLGHSEAKDLIMSDWEYWGDVRLDTGSIVIDQCDDLVWVTAKATVRYEFDTSEDKYKKMINFVKSFLDTENPNYILPNKYKAGLMNWILVQVLHERAPQKRQYLWPMRLSAVLKRYNGKLLFTEMQFCLPAATKFPDVRLGNDEAMNNNVREGKKQISQYLVRTENLCGGEIKDTMEEFVKDYSSKEIDASALAEKYFVNDGSQSIINTDLSLHMGGEAVENILSELRKKWFSVELFWEDIIERRNEETALLAAWGSIKSNIDEEGLFSSLMHEIDRVLKKDIAEKEKLFYVQRSIAYAYKEVSWGRSVDICFKLEAVMQRVDDKWKFSKLQLSFPFYYFLEGMYDIQ